MEQFGPFGLVTTQDALRACNVQARTAAHHKAQLCHHSRRYDVLHDATDPGAIIKAVRGSIAPDGSWFVADIKCEHGVKANVEDNPAAALCYGFSIQLCMSSSMSCEGGAGLGTLGLSVPTAERLLVEEGGFASVAVLPVDGPNTRFFEVLP